MQKWARRHPRLTSSTTVGVVAFAVLAGVAVSWGCWAYREARRDEAQQSFTQFQELTRSGQYLLLTQAGDPAQRAAGLTAIREGLERYQVLSDPAWPRLPLVRYLGAEQQERLRGDIGELLLSWVRAITLETADDAKRADRDSQLRFALQLNQLAEKCFRIDDVPAVLWKQRAEVTKLLDRAADVRELLDRGKAEASRGSRDSARSPGRPAPAPAAIARLALTA